MHVDILHAIIAVGFLVVLAIVVQIIKWPRSSNGQLDFPDLGGPDSALSDSDTMVRTSSAKARKRLAERQARKANRRTDAVNQPSRPAVPPPIAPTLENTENSSGEFTNTSYPGAGYDVY